MVLVGDDACVGRFVERLVGRFVLTLAARVRRRLTAQAMPSAASSRANSTRATHTGRAASAARARVSPGDGRGVLVCFVGLAVGRVVVGRVEFGRAVGRLDGAVVISVQFALQCLKAFLVPFATRARHSVWFCFVLFKQFA